jgi:chromate transporter
MTRASEPALAAPASLRELFLAFNRLALQGFGGVLPVAQRELVERRNWLTKDEFVEMLAISQVLPGPNVVNLALMFGDRAFGWRGAMAALGGMLLAPMVIVLALTALYVRFDAYPSLKRNVMGLSICLGFGALMLIATAWLRLPLVWVLLVLGLSAIGVAWVKLKRP